MKDTEKQVVILGGGLCGLTAARELAIAGKRVVVLEKEAEEGGLCRTIEKGGCRVDQGSHRFHTDAYRGNARRVIESIDPKMLRACPRYGLIRFNRRYVPYPPHLYDLVRTFTARQLWGCFRGLVRQKMRPEPVPERPNFESHIVGKIGREAYELFYRDAAHKHWYLPPRKLSVDEVKKRVETTEPIKVFWDTIRGCCGFRSGKKMTFLYPPGGIGVIAQSLARDFKEKGGRIYRGVSLTSLEVSGKGEVASVGFRVGGEECRLPAEAVFSTIPLNRLVELLSCPKPPAVREAVAEFSWRALRIFYCRVPMIEWSEAETFYFPEMKYPFGRISRPRLFDDSMGCDSPGELICIELACTRGDKTWNEPDAKLLERLVPPLREAGLLKPATRPLDFGHFSERESHVYPVLHVGWREAFDAVYGWLTGIGNLYTIGRHGLYLHNNMDQTMDLGYRCAHHFLSPGPEGRRNWDENIEHWSNLKIKY